jgi:hypothetical protein
MISVRSYLIAGTAAVVGAGAIALTPVPSHPAPSPGALPAAPVAEIALTGVTLPLTDVIGVLQTLGGLGGSLTGVLGGFLPQQFIDDVVAEVLNQATPLLTAAAGEVFDYLGSALSGLLVGPDSIPARLGAAVGNIPAALAAAVQALSTGDIAGAVQAVTIGLAAPLTEFGRSIEAASQSFQNFLVNELNGVVGALPGILLSAIQTVFGNTIQASLDTITGALSGLFGGLLPAVGAPAAPGAAAAAVVAGEDVTALGLVESGVVGAPARVAEAPVRAVAPLAEEAADPVAITTVAEVESSVAEVESSVAEVESSALAAAPAETVAPVNRPRRGGESPALSESVAAGSSTVTRPKSTVRGARAAADRPSSGAAPRAARAAE